MNDFVARHSQVRMDVLCGILWGWGALDEGSVGLMDKASASRAGDSRLESWTDHRTNGRSLKKMHCHPSLPLALALLQKLD